MKYYINEDSDFLMHHGIKGQKWGERRFQNEDGTLTPEGKARYAKYVKEFGEKTAQRLMKTQSKGYSESQALHKEYRRRKYGSGARIGATIGGSLAGEIAAELGADALTNRKGNQQVIGTYQGMNVLGPKKTFDRRTAGWIGFGVGAVLGDLGGRQIDKVKNGYTSYDLSNKGIKEFYNKMKKEFDYGKPGHRG